MEEVIKSLTPHLTSVINLSLLQKIDTGNKALDMSYQMLLSTLVGAIITGVVHIILSGYIQKTIYRIKTALKIGKYNPIEFDPHSASGKPVNNQSFLYSASFSKLIILSKS